MFKKSNEIQYTRLGRTDLEVSRICFGTWATGKWWWGNVDDDDSIEAIRESFSLGINFFDTADVYGGGHAETLLAKALGKNRKNAVIATKGAVQFDEKGATGITNDPAYLKKACEASLKRLQVEAIDLYQVHWPDNKTPLDDVMNALVDLQESGKIRYFGLSNFGYPAIETALDVARFESLQPRYNMLHREIEEEVLPFCEDNEIAVLAYSPMASGLLTGKYRSDSTFPEGDHRQTNPDFTGDQYLKNLNLVRYLKLFAEQCGCSVVQLVLNWTLAQPGVTCAICGVKNIYQMEEMIECFDNPLGNKEIQKINKILDKFAEGSLEMIDEEEED